MIIKAILKINPNAKVSVFGDDINTCEIQWHDNTNPISKSDIQAQFPIVELEIAMENLRAKRDALLNETDWWGASDNTMTDAQKKYRQDLRDITEGLTTVEEVEAVEFPTKP
tara:strand:+ start:585 stop:920 length:336 start_codon:yes stop_codon:yes gene_type:complete